MQSCLQITSVSRVIEHGFMPSFLWISMQVKTGFHYSRMNQISHNSMCMTRKVIYSNIKWQDYEKFGHVFDTLRSRQDGHHFTDNILKLIFLNHSVSIWINNSQKFIPQGIIGNNASIVSDICLLPSQHQAVICTNNGLAYWIRLKFMHTLIVYYMISILYENCLN